MADLRPKIKKGWFLVETNPFDFYGRDGGIRTRDPLHPMQVRYQAALRPEAANYRGKKRPICLSGHEQATNRQQLVAHLRN
jgi:hypothetical protein